MTRKKEMPSDGPPTETEIKAAKYDRIVAELVKNNRWIQLRSCADTIQNISLIIDPEGNITDPDVQVWE